MEDDPIRIPFFLKVRSQHNHWLEENGTPYNPISASRARKMKKSSHFPIFKADRSTTLDP